MRFKDILITGEPYAHTTTCLGSASWSPALCGATAVIVWWWYFYTAGSHTLEESRVLLFRPELLCPLSILFKVFNCIRSYTGMVACFCSKHLDNSNGRSDCTDVTSKIELGKMTPSGDKGQASHDGSFPDVASSPDRHLDDNSTGETKQQGSVGELVKGGDDGMATGGRDGDGGGGVMAGDADEFGLKDEDEETVWSAVWLMMGNLQSASFFAAVGLSGMGVGIIDTFLFIR